MVIGGDEDDEVLKIGTTIIPFQSHLSKKRFLAATTPKNQSLWVTGGKDASFKDSKLKSTDIIQRDGTIVVGPELPLALSQHAIVEIQPDETYMLIGGNTDDAFASKVTFVYHARIGKWTKGPDLLQGRYAHSAGILHDIATHHPYTVVVGGLQNDGSELLPVEFLRSGSLRWTQCKHIHVLHFPNMYLHLYFLGPPLPVPLYCHQMVSWNNNLVVLGGVLGGVTFSKSRYLLQCKDGKFTWEKVDARWSQKRKYFAAIKITESIALRWIKAELLP